MNLKMGLTAAAIALLSQSAMASVYYVAPNGNDANAGSKDKPFASLNKANTKVVAGDTVWVRGGTYMHKDTTYVKNDNMFAGIHLTKSGTSDNNRIHYLAYPGETPVFDFSQMPIANGTNNVRYTNGILIQAQYLHLKGLEFKNVPMKGESNVGVYISRSKHIFLELINSHHHGGSGFFVNERGTGSAGGHLFLNCDSHDNYDPNGRQGDGQNADGFGVHYQTSGDTTKFIGCRAWWNSDDGWDFISQEFPVVIENSWAMGHGYSNYGTGKPKDGNGNGFKAGSSKTGIRHTIRNCVAWKNKASGFYANHSSGGNDWLNNTAYMNGTAFNMWASTWDANDNRTDGVILKGTKAHVMKNNIAFPNKTAYIGGEYAAGEYNTWNLNLTATNADFISVDDPSMTVTGKPLEPLGGAFGPRKADGSLPDLDFLKLSPKSQFIDKGVNVKLPYEGKAPDLGAYEYKAYVEPVIPETPKDTVVPPETPKDTAAKDSVTTPLQPEQPSDSVTTPELPADTLATPNLPADSTTSIAKRMVRNNLNLRNGGRSFYINGRVVRNRKGPHLTFIK